MNRCDYDHLIKLRERTVVTDHFTLLAVSYPVMETLNVPFYAMFVMDI